jgi:hypothetical protein
VLILFYNTIFGSPIACGPDDLLPGCEATYDRARFGEADAVVFHIPNLWFWQRPRKRPGQLWVAFSIESDVNYPILRDPARMARFDLTMTYRRDADVLWGYVPYFSSADNLERALVSPVAAKDAERPVAMLISSRIDKSGRRAYLRELSRHIGIDSWGRFMRNRTLPKDAWRPSKLELIRRYPFTIAFENSIAEDYVTEKFYDPLVVGSVPVYLGAPNVRDFAPGEQCYIDARDHDGPRALAAYLTSLLNDRAAYAEWLAWKSRPLRPAFRQWLDGQRTPPLRRLCEALLARREAGPRAAAEAMTPLEQGR